MDELFNDRIWRKKAEKFGIRDADGLISLGKRLVGIESRLELMENAMLRLGNADLSRDDVGVYNGINECSKHLGRVHGEVNMLLWDLTEYEDGREEED